MGIISRIKECASSWLARRKEVTKKVILLTLWHKCLLIRAEMPLKDWYTVIESSNTLIGQSNHLATETRMSIIMGIIYRLDAGIKKG